MVFFDQITEILRNFFNSALEIHFPAIFWSANGKRLNVSDAHPPRRSWIQDFGTENNNQCPSMGIGMHEWLIRFCLWSQKSDNIRYTFRQVIISSRGVIISSRRVIIFSSSHKIFSSSRNVFSLSRVRMSFRWVECLFVESQCLFAELQ